MWVERKHRLGPCILVAKDSTLTAERAERRPTFSRAAMWSWLLQVDDKVDDCVHGAVAVAAKVY